MGNTLENLLKDDTNYVYARDEFNNWLTEPVDYSINNIISKFKHYVFSYALNERLQNCKALYYYNGRVRLIKVVKLAKSIIIYFKNNEIFEKFLNCSESLVDYKITFRNRIFNNNFDISLYKVKKDDLLMIQYEKRG